MIIILVMGVLFLPMEREFQFIKLVLVGLIIFYIIAKPKDDLAVTREFLLHIKRSAITKFSRIDKYKISAMTSIRCGGIHTDSWELVDFFNGGGNSGGHSNTVEMSFKNGESKSLQLSIDRKKLNKIVRLIYELKQNEA
ncbi:hypothetical protein E1171_00300 [Cytophagales bacterium RKSG123]|nr:hypothetical protein [Xanthovirga aplysinae]